jgi:SAM-dependent methyltransferase
MPDALYDRIGVGYSARRRPDERIAARLAAALGSCRSVLNVGAGTGSYEPAERFVVAIEPSAEMIRQRPATAAPVLQAVADRLPFRDRSFDAVLAVLTIHHWPKPEKGLAEMRRIARDRVVILTWDPQHPGFWLVQDYFPEIVEIDRRIFPTAHAIERVIGPVETHVVPVPSDCRDGFLGAYWRRPAEYLDADVRGAMSAFSKIDATSGLKRLQRDLEGGAWLERHRALESMSELDVGYRLFVAPCA